ncbi:MAG: sodium-dependent bicarbonate transport family permease [Opitutaceae bacterium]|nr:sodium-dependent bicarbonate transport family permease [Cytophagales bacterium]
MQFSDLFQNFLNTPVLFFFLGMIAIALKSNLEIPQPLPKFISLYLLFSIGIKGGAELSHSGFGNGILGILVVAILMSALVPVYAFFILKKKTSIPNAAALAATYGSVSAVTFITAVAFLQSKNVAFGGHMVAAMALMEAPAIIMAVVLYKLHNKVSDNKTTLGHTIKDAFTEGSIIMILGSLLIGLIVGQKGFESVKPFAGDMFKGILCLFLLDMGLVAARRLKDLKETGMFSLVFALLVPLLNAIIGIFLAYLLNMSQGDALMFTVLCASASYIAVPAAMRVAIPESNPGIYVPMSLAITFPFNVVFGIPLYYYIIQNFI